MLYVPKMTQNKNDSINSILQYGRVFDTNCSVVSLIMDFHISSCVPDSAKGR